MSALMSDDDLACILGENPGRPLWVANPPQINQPEDNFLSGLGIRSWTTKDLISALATRTESMHAWLASKTDEWHQQFYAFLGEYLTNEQSHMPRVEEQRKAALTQLRIVRAGDGTYRIGGKSFFPSDDIEVDAAFPRVAKGVYSSGRNTQQQSKAHRFLEDIGVREVGEAEQIEAILKQRYSSNAVERKDSGPRLNDIGRFIALVEEDSSQASLFEPYSVLKKANDKWDAPKRVYLDEPFLLTGLSAYFEPPRDDLPLRALSQSYLNVPEVTRERIGRFAKAIGAKACLSVTPAHCCENRDWGCLSSVPGSRRSSPIDRDYVIPELVELLKVPSERAARLVWLTMGSLDPEYLTATYQINHASGYRTAPSQIVHHLKNCDWVPQARGESIVFVKPRDAAVDELPPRFPYEAGQKWLEAVEFGAAAKTRSEVHVVRNRQAREMGFAGEDEAQKMKLVADLLRQIGKSPDQLIAELAPQRGNIPDLPSRPVTDRERRREKLDIDLGSAPMKDFERRLRSVRITEATDYTRVWLREQYTHDDTHRMYCQICREEMPFRKRNGEYYFEAVEALNRHLFNAEHEAQFLALCPLCAAKYKEYVKRDEDAMIALTDVLRSAEDTEVPVTLGGTQTTIWFVGTHRFDIKTILQPGKEGERLCRPRSAPPEPQSTPCASPVGNSNEHPD